MRALTSAVCTALLSLVLAVGCEQDPVASTPDPPATVAGPRAAPASNSSGDPKTARFLGLTAPKPATWMEQTPASQMRAATYTVPGPEDHEAAEIVVFYFGPGQGGPVQANIERWQSQFKPAPDGTPAEPRVERFDVDGMPVTFVEVTGEWRGMGADSYTPDQLFLAAIVEAPAGNVYIRFVGETATVEAGRGDFVTMVRGLRKESGFRSQESGREDPER